MLFSDRIGVTIPSKQLQLDSIDNDLRNGLWNIYRKVIIDELSPSTNRYLFNAPNLEALCFELWHNHFKKTVEELPDFTEDVPDQLKRIFFKANWYETYNLIQFTIDTAISKQINLDIDDVCAQFNQILQREFSGYRFVGTHLTPITNTDEISSIEGALISTRNSKLNICNIHLQQALKKLSLKPTADYRNSIKESISAVEALAKLISGNDKDSLGSAIDKIKGKLKIHASLERAFKNLYGYTSDGDGIRHALTEESQLDFEDAQFMLVSCSGFINYLLQKANKAGISFA